MLNTIIEKTKFDEKELEIIREEESQKLYKALDCFKGRSVVIESIDGLMLYRPMDDFNYNLKQNVNKQMILDFENDNEFVVGIAVKLDNIFEIDIDDNEEFIRNDMMNHYECESIIITLWNNSKLRISLE